MKQGREKQTKMYYGFGNKIYMNDTLLNISMTRTCQIQYWFTIVCTVWAQYELNVPSVKLSTYRAYAFNSSGHAVRNNIPEHLRDSSLSLDVLK